MNQAQGAIETARAAGADRYAPEEYRAAVAALDKSREMADGRDYRQALNFALDARERAQDAARAGAERMAQLRGQAETLVQTATTTLQTAQARAKAGAAGRTPERALTALRETIARAEKSLQEARTAIGRQDYAKARDDAKAVADGLTDALAALDAAPGPRERRAPGRKPVR